MQVQFNFAAVENHFSGRKQEEEEEELCNGDRKKKKKKFPFNLQ